MNEISIVDAWVLWLSGHLSPDLMIWGVSIFWWGRLGKIMQAIGAITIIADIIGPEKIRAFGASLQGAVTSAILINFLRNCFEWYKTVFRHTVMKDYEDTVAPITRQSGQFKLDVLNYFVCFLLTILVVSSIGLQDTGWILIVETAIIFCCLLVSISPLITVLILMLLTFAGLVINLVFIKSLASALEHPSLDRFTKIASLLFLLVGFHFELLAS